QRERLREKARIRRTNSTPSGFRCMDHAVAAKIKDQTGRRVGHAQRVATILILFIWGGLPFAILFSAKGGPSFGLFFSITTIQPPSRPGVPSRPFASDFRFPTSTI